MAARGGAVHVATTTVNRNGQVYRTHLLRRSYRDGDKVKHETLGNISHLPDAVIEIIRRSLGGQAYVPVSDSFQYEIVRSLPHGHVAAVLGTLRKLGLEAILSSRDCEQRNLAVAMIVARVICPGSKLSTARMLNPEIAFSSLGPVLGLETATEDDLYAAMDWLVQRQTRIETKLAKRHLHDGSLILYDVSSSYYTGTHCPLARFGHDRDGSKGFPQIVYGLLCSADGCPVAVEVFSGNTADPTTVKNQIAKIRDRFQLQRVVLVGDRGMITSARIDQEFRGVEGLQWITCLRAPAIKKLAEQQVIQPSLFDEHDLVEVSSPDYPGERLVVCRNPLLAAERTRKREELLQATEKMLNKISAATQRATRPLKGKDTIGLRVGRCIDRFKMKKHFELEITETSFGFHRNTQGIAEEAALDGLYVIRTSVSEADLTAESTVRAYKDLSKVERAFRSLKTVDLKVRPIYHRDDDRVRCHVFLCMLAYYVEWHMRQALKSILFDDEDREAAEAQRPSIVAPAPRSKTAKDKAQSKRTADGKPVHSFQTLLKDLATITRNHLRAVEGSVEFDQVTQATPHQRYALDLLGVATVV